MPSRWQSRSACMEVGGQYGRCCARREACQSSCTPGLPSVRLSGLPVTADTEEGSALLVAILSPEGSTAVSTRDGTNTSLGPMPALGFDNLVRHMLGIQGAQTLIRGQLG